MATKSQITQALSILANAFPNSRIVAAAPGVPGTLDIYAEMLSDLDGADLLAAVRYCLSTCPAYLPSIAIIRSAAETLRVARTGGEPSGQEAWGQVLAAVREYGTLGTPKFADDRVRRAVDCLGWRVICQSDEQDPAIRSQFVRAFEVIAARARTDAVVAQIDAAVNRSFSIMGATARKLERKLEDAK